MCGSATIDDSVVAVVVVCAARAVCGSISTDGCMIEFAGDSMSCIGLNAGLAVDSLLVVDADLTPVDDTIL